MSWTDKKISLSSLLGSTDKQSKNQVNNLFTHYVLQAVVWLIFKVRIFFIFSGVCPSIRFLDPLPPLLSILYMYNVYHMDIIDHVAAAPGPLAYPNLT